MEKQIFNIPDGCKFVSVEQVGNQIITTFEPEKYVPKVGDCVKMRYDINNNFVYAEITEIFGNKLCCEKSWISYIRKVEQEAGYFFDYTYIEKITTEELQAEFNKLGYQYDFETHEAKKLRWKPEKKERYFCVLANGEIVTYLWENDFDDNEKYDFGNCFKTKEEAEAFRDYIKKYKP